MIYKYNIYKENLLTGDKEVLGSSNSTFGYYKMKNYHYYQYKKEVNTENINQKTEGKNIIFYTEDSPIRLIFEEN